MIVRIVSPLVNAFPHQARIPSSSAKLLSPLAINWLISRDARAIKKAAKETAREHKKFGKQVADIYRGSEEK